MSVDVVLPDGDVVPIDGALLVGRDPVVPSGHEHAEVVAIAGDLSVSKTHALIELHAGDVWVTDLDSRNGTEIVDESGGEATLPSGVRTVLTDGSVLRIGSTTVLSFERPPQTVEPSATAPHRDLALGAATATAHNRMSPSGFGERSPSTPTHSSEIAPASELPPPAVALASAVVPGDWSQDARGVQAPPPAAPPIVPSPSPDATHVTVPNAAPGYDTAAARSSPPPTRPGHGAPGTSVGLAHRQVVGRIVPLPLGSRIAAALLDGLIAVLTLGIGWFIWAVILWPQGTSPGKKMVGAVVVDHATGVVAGADKMALREIVGKGVIGFFTLGISGVVTFFMVLFGRERRGVPDYVAGTIVVPVSTVGVVPIGSEGMSVARARPDGGSPAASAATPFFTDRDLQRAFTFSMLLVAGLVPIAIAAGVDSTAFVPEFHLGSGVALVLGCVALVAATFLARSRPIARGVGIGVGLIVGASFAGSMFDYVLGSYGISVPGAIGSAACAAGGLGAAAMLSRAWVPRRMPEIAPQDYPGIIAALALFPVLLMSSNGRAFDWRGFEGSQVVGLLVVFGTAVLCGALAVGFVLGSRGVGIHAGILGYMLLAWLITPAPHVLLAPGTGLAVEGLVAILLFVIVVALAVWHAMRTVGHPPVGTAGPPTRPGAPQPGPPPAGQFRQRWVAALLAGLVPLVAACATDPESGSTSEPAPREVDLPEVSDTPQSASTDPATAPTTTPALVVGVTNPPTTPAPLTTVPPATTVPTETVPAPAPASSDPCSDSTVQAVWGAGARIIDGLCSNGWAYVDTCTGECGDSQIIARHRGGTWEFAIGFPTPMCRADALAAGVPSQIVDRIGWVCAGGGGNIEYRPEPATGVLSIGDRGPRVESLQRELYFRDFLRSGDVDNHFGPGTRDAVRAFQRSVGLEVDGLAGPNTLGALGLPS